MTDQPNEITRDGFATIAFALLDSAMREDWDAIRARVDTLTAAETATLLGVVIAAWVTYIHQSSPAVTIARTRAMMHDATINEEPPTR